MKVARYNYSAQFGPDRTALLDELDQMLTRGDYVLSEQVRRFECSLAEYLGVRHVCGVGSGTDALVLSLRALGIGQNDEVIVPANTFHSTVAAVVLVGAKPVLVDVDEATMLLDVAHVEASITLRTRVLLPVHLFGKPAPMDRLTLVAERHGLYIVEDAAQAHGARYSGKRVGGFGISSCFSFHPSKNLAAAGDGGAVATNDDRLFEYVQQARSLGQSNQNDHQFVGLNSKLDAIQAAILSWKLPHLDRWNAARRTIAVAYRERLEGLPVVLQRESSDEEHVYHLFQVRTPQRDALLAHLCNSAVDAVIRYPVPIHLQVAFREQGWKSGDFPVAEQLSRDSLCLPIRPDMTLDEVDFVCDCMHGFFRQADKAHRVD